MNNIVNLLAFVLLAEFSFCSGSPLNTSSIQWIDCASRPPWTLDVTDIDLQKLPSTLHCGEMVVPMNYAKPIGPNNNITVGLAMYRPRNPVGVIFFNPGGTDEATIFAWQAALNLTDVFSGLLDYDLMMMDTRSTYSSNSLNVSLDAFDGLMGAYPTTQAQFDTYKNKSAAMIQSFVDLSSPPGIIQHVGTREVVQDYELIRKALGYEKINFVGSSYGSYRAAQYATTFPHHVGNFVLDSIVPHGIDVFDEAQAMVVAMNRGLLRADAFCQNNASCPLKSKGRGSVPKAFVEIVTADQSRALAAPACGNASLGCVTPVSLSDVQTGLLNYLSDHPDFPMLLDAVALAATGDGTGLALAAGDPLPNIQPTWGVVFSCNDYHLGNRTFENFQKSFKAAEQKDTYKIGKTTVWQIQLQCSGWPYAVTSAPLPTFEAPILLLTADFDNNTPTEIARRVWKGYPQGALVIRHGDGHVSFTLPDQPATKIAKNFLRTGKLPAARNETQVAVYRTGMSLQPIANPYNVGTGPIAGDVDSA